MEHGGPPNTPEFIRANCVPLENIDQIPGALLGRLSPFPLIAIGECHGTEEAPAFTGTLLESIAVLNGKVRLGLELPQSSQGTIDRFLLTGDPDELRRDPFFSAPWDAQCGLTSVAMVRLLEKARQMRTPVFAFLNGKDTPSQNGHEALMARRIAHEIHLHPNEKFLILAGGGHNRLLPASIPGTELVPMLLQLERLMPWGTSGIHNITVRAGFRRAFALVGKGTEAPQFGLFEHDGRSGSWSTAVAHPIFYVPNAFQEEGYAATLFVREGRASPPFCPGS